MKARYPEMRDAVIAVLKEYPKGTTASLIARHLDQASIAPASYKARGSRSFRDRMVSSALASLVIEGIVKTSIGPGFRANTEARYYEIKR